MADTKEPRNFYLRWVWRTFAGPWGHASLWGSILPLLIPAALKFIRPLHKYDATMNDLIWEVPLVVFMALAVIRFFIAPWSIYRDERARAEAAEAKQHPAFKLLTNHGAAYMDVLDGSN